MVWIYGIFPLTKIGISIDFLNHFVDVFSQVELDRDFGFISGQVSESRQWKIRLFPRGTKQFRSKFIIVFPIGETKDLINLDVCIHKQPHYGFVHIVVFRSGPSIHPQPFSCEGDERLIQSRHMHVQTTALLFVGIVVLGSGGHSPHSPFRVVDERHIQSRL